MYGDALSIIDVVVPSGDGNVSLPKAIMEKLHITPGTKFAVVVEKDTIIFKRIHTPSEEDFEKLVEKGTEIAERNKIEDTEDIVHKYRSSILQSEDVTSPSSLLERSWSGRSILAAFRTFMYSSIFDEYFSISPSLQ